MSQVLKRLGSVSSGEKSLVGKTSFNSWLHQWHLKSGEPYSWAGAAAQGSKLTGWRRRPEGRCGFHFLAAAPIDDNRAMKMTSLKPVGTRRSMSILTDLLGRNKKTVEEEDAETAPPETRIMPLFEEAPKELTEEEIEAKRNVSRLNVFHQRLVHGELPYTEPMTWIHHTVKYKQRMFGRYGESSGVNPGVLWPTRDELKERIEYEKICNPFTIQEMMEKKRALREAEKMAVEKRIKEVEAKMAMVDKFKQDLDKRIQAKEREASEAQARRDKLVEEVRRHFGYTVDPREDRFQELLAKKEKEQKKSMKEARKLEKQQKMLQKLEGKPVKSKSERKPSTEKDDDKDDD